MLLFSPFERALTARRRREGKKYKTEKNQFGLFVFECDRCAFFCSFEGLLGEEEKNEMKQERME